MLRELITQSGETQAVWATRIGVSAPYLSALLAGRKEPSLRVAARIESLTDGRVRAASWVAAASQLPATNPKEAAE